MNTSTLQKLEQLATLAGLQTAYDSAFGNKVSASPEGLLHVLNGITEFQLKADLSNLDSVYDAQLGARWKTLCDPILVAWEGKPTTISLRLIEHAKFPKHAQLKIKLEGKTKPLNLLLPLTKAKNRLREQINGNTFIQKDIVFKKKLPLGYHPATLRIGAQKASLLIISSPWLAYRPKGDRRRWLGAFAPLYAVRTAQSWGMGDFSDLGRLTDWAYQNRFDFVGTLPMLSIFNDKPIVEPSPYSPLSRLHWNEMYVDPRAADEWKTCAQVRLLSQTPAFLDRLEALNALKEVDYQATARFKREILQLMSEEFFARKKERSKAFKAFLKLYPTADLYAAFRATGETRNETWPHWPERLRNGHVSDGDYKLQLKRYHLYVQFLAHTQLQALSKASMEKGKGIYIDFPLSAHAEGFDVWSERESFGQTCSAGCPPDPAHVHGQDWGILPLNPNSIRKNGYRYFRRCLEAHMRYAGMLRLDHVMCFYRLYWVPHGLGAKNGVYIRYKMDEFFALLILESHRNQCVLIGEDLGTVPPEIRQAMTQHKILRMYVQQRRLSTDAKDPLPEPPTDCICSLNTHDMPPFAAFWKGLDLLDKMDLGYFGSSELPAKQKVRDDQKKALIAFLMKHKLIKTPMVELNAILTALLKYTASSPAKIMQINIEDLWLETLPQNVPGTWKERPNWRRRWKHSLEQLEDMTELKSLLLELKRRRAR